MERVQSTRFISYASECGTTGEVAEAIGDALCQDGNTTALINGVGVRVGCSRAKATSRLSS